MNNDQHLLAAFGAGALLIAVSVFVGDIVTAGAVTDVVGDGLARSMTVIGFTALSIVAVLQWQARKRE